MFFSKMHGLGNDFMIIDHINQKINLTSQIIKNLSNRNTGVGFDQLLLVENSNNLKVDFNYKIFNANGMEVSQCGNGVRCLTLFTYIKKLTKKKKITIMTKNSFMIAKIIKNNLIKVNMGEPNFNPKYIPFISDKIKKKYTLNINNKYITCGVVSVGNPHCVIIVKNINDNKILKIGKLLEIHNNFPEGANINFMQIININKINLRVYERGVGETQSCGSGACASVAVGIQQGKLSNNVKVVLKGGELKIKWQGLGYPLFMTGSAYHVYDGIIKI